METQQQIAVTYFEPDSRKKGDVYVSVHGIARKNDTSERYIKMVDGRRNLLIIFEMLSLRESIKIEPK